jgi:hypothetical protein
MVGRADQDRFGELLMPQVLGRLLSFSKARCAGLVGADFSDRGGSVASSYGDALLDVGGSRLKLIHFGGDILGIDLVEGYRIAAVGEEAERFESLSAIGGRDELSRYVSRRTGQISDLAYVLEPEGEFWGAGLAFHAVGLSAPGSLDRQAKDRLLQALRRSEFVGVRDANGAAFLEAEGIEVERMPCVLSVLPEVCAAALATARTSDALDALGHRFPDGWISVETSAIPADQFDRLVAALRCLAEQRGLGLVFFEADRTADRARRVPLRRWAESFPEWRAAEFASDNLWEMASLLLRSRLHCGASLASRIVCMAGGVPRIGIPTGSPEVSSYCALWEHEAMPAELPEDGDWGQSLGEAMAVGHLDLRNHAQWLSQQYRQSLARFCRATGTSLRAEAGGHPPVPEPISGAGHHLDDQWLESAGFEAVPTHCGNRRVSRVLASSVSSAP